MAVYQIWKRATHGRQPEEVEGHDVVVHENAVSIVDTANRTVQVVPLDLITKIRRLP